MATSGGYVTNQISHSRFYFNWQLTGQNVGDNKSNINWQAGLTNNLSGGTDLFYSNAVKIYSVYINGSGNLGSGTWSNITTSGDHQLLSGNIDIYHNSDGTKDFGASMSAWTYSASNYSGSSAWTLPAIPRHAVITGATGSINDTATTAQITFNNPAGTAVNVYLELPSLSLSNLAAQSNVSSGVSLTLNSTFWNAVYTAMAGVNSTTLRYVIHDTLGGVASWSYLDYTVSIVNANPTFSTITYKDNNSATTTITGNNQYLIQGNSILEVDIASGDKAVAIKSATMSKYNFAVSSYSQDLTYTTSAVTKTIGAISDSTNQLLTVKAIDSRSNFTAVTSNINVIPYQAPQVVATGKRQNDFEATTTIHIEGLISLLTISGSNKNAVDVSTGVKYRYVEKGASWSGVTWVNKTNSTNSSTGAVSVTDFTLSLDNTKSYDFQVTITDKLNTIEYDFNVLVGIPIFRIGVDGFVRNNEQILMTSHIGQIIMTAGLTTAASVAAIYGGTWVAWGAGRVPVGMGSNGTTNYTTVEATGGEEKHTLTNGEMPIHSITISHHSDETGSVIRQFSGTGGTTSQISVPSSYKAPPASTPGASSYQSPTVTWGSNTPHNNLQPYITAYMWERVS